MDGNLPPIFKVHNHPINYTYSLTTKEAEARQVFEKEIADPMNKRCHISLERDGVLIDHAGDGWERGALCRPPSP